LQKLFSETLEASENVESDGRRWISGSQDLADFCSQNSPAPFAEWCAPLELIAVMRTTFWRSDFLRDTFSDEKSRWGKYQEQAFPYIFSGVVFSKLPGSDHERDDLVFRRDMSFLLEFLGKSRPTGTLGRVLVHTSQALFEEAKGSYRLRTDYRLQPESLGSQTQMELEPKSCEKIFSESLSDEFFPKWAGGYEKKIVEQTGFLILEAGLK